mmetsp:Transcript_31484/g.62897  ORF Transcript_31484/g.62897 Transcript_31484/m.62897 type:complete len:211 (-) Transcript_31484:70-702(-)
MLAHRVGGRIALATPWIAAKVARVAFQETGPTVVVIRRRLGAPALHADARWGKRDLVLAGDAMEREQHHHGVLVLGFVLHCASSSSMPIARTGVIRVGIIRPHAWLARQRRRSLLPRRIVTLRAGRFCSGIHADLQPGVSHRLERGDGAFAQRRVCQDRRLRHIGGRRLGVQESPRPLWLERRPQVLALEQLRAQIEHWQRICPSEQIGL